MLEDDKEVRNSDLPADLLAQMEGPHPPDDFVSNGCTKSPDYVGAMTLQPACHHHDYSYALYSFTGEGGTEQARMKADTELYRNLVRLGLRRRRAYYYFAGTHVFGHDAYSYAPDAKPKRGFFFWIKLSATLFWRW
jgi:hypothetical protein